ncbi:NAD(+) diphosphatase [Gulosibacter sp. 10]|uniref:NAD(+) diphosphatase n=1 Tax=Gulosibacter sp. 10 TaxID=1255570 RepID=UPI000B34E986|nr:NAD(+) diphosphatase [Gulosibacter sp. 10]
MNDFAARLPLARTRIDRDDLGRESAFSLLEDPTSRMLLQRRDTALVAPRGEGLALDLRLGDTLPEIAEPIYLGRLIADRENPDGRVDAAGTPIFAVELGDFDASQVEPDADRWPMLNESALSLDDLDAGLYAEALGIRNFHRAHRHSPTTGERLAAEHGGWVLRPEDGGQPIFPRTDPAIIVGVVDAQDRILLGANVNWTPRRYSTFAGFVEPGESFEQAVARELAEEANVRIANARYLGSQPWPFPASLMVGFLAELAPDQDPETVAPDNVEIAEVRWFTREEVLAHKDQLPPTVSISRAIIEEWYGGPIR